MIHDFGPSGNRGERKAATEALGRDDHIRRDAVVLACEHFAGASKSRLHLVGDQQNSVPAADIVQSRKKLRRWRHETTFAQYGLNNNRSYRFRGHNLAERLFESA